MRRKSLAVERWGLARRLALGDPRLLMDYACWYVADRVRPGRRRPERRPPVAVMTPATARRRIGEVAGDWTDGPALARVRAWKPPVAGIDEASRMRARMAGDTSLGELIYGLVRVLRPTLVVETGVATGVTSAYILAALADNQVGMLHSIDLPPTCLIAADYVGVAVPPELRSRWVYSWGAARRLLPKILRSTAGDLSLFVHDSDHSYGHMRWELESAWQALVPGGWLVADDVELHSAFGDVAAAVAAEPLYVAQVAKPGWTGLVQKQAVGAHGMATPGRAAGIPSGSTRE